MTLAQVRAALTNLGYDVIGYQAMGCPRRYHCERTPKALALGLPKGGVFDLAGLKAFAHSLHI